MATLYYASVSRFPSITHDIALVVDSEKVASELQAIIQLSGARMLKAILLFDLYEGEKMDPVKKLVAFTLTYFDLECTLNEQAGAELKG